MNLIDLKSVVLEKYFCCPLCHEDMYISENKKSAYCKGAKKHCFDFSKDGYLGMSFSAGGDSKIAVDARKLFLEKDYYLPIAKEVVEIIEKYVKEESFLVDAGCGEGYYTNHIAQKNYNVVGFDLSKFGCIAGAKSAKKSEIFNVLYSTASVFELPLKMNVVDCITNIFAPCAESEYNRVLKDDGVLILVGAGKDHLMGLKEILYDNIYQNGQRADLPQNMKLEEKRSLKYDIEVVGKENIENLFSMTPYYWRTGEQDKIKLQKTEVLKTLIDIEFYIYKKQF